jgi:tetratricopeptide (TPR) repeat protein
MLDELKQRLFIQRNTERLAIFGLGGIGKTQVALHLARWVKAHVPDCSIFWASAISLESFEQACAKIAKELQISRNTDEESAMEMVHRQLSSDNTGKWLFIVDNADDEDLLFDELHQRFPASKSGVILLTTRSREIAMSFAGRDIVELQNMTEEEGIAFLSKIIGEEPPSGEESMKRLLEELNFLPLAISQAAHYICRNNGTTTRYLEIMQKSEKDRMRLASRNFHDSTRYPKMPNAVTTTWLISFNQIRDSDPSAIHLLEFMSYLEPKAIPRSILPTLDSEEEMDFAIGTLCSYGFLTRRGNEDMFDMHSLVQLSTRMWIADAQKTQQIITSVTQHMESCFPSDEYTNREKWRIYLPHAFGILWREEIRDLRERFSLLFKAVKCILADGRAKEADNLLGDVDAWTQSHYDEEDPDRPVSQHEPAGADQFQQDEPTLEQLDRMESVLELLELMAPLKFELLPEYGSKRQSEQVMEIIEYVKVLRERILNDEHLDELASKSGLAKVYQNIGLLEQVLELSKHAAALRERTLDDEHPDRLAFQHEFARACHSKGQIKRALELLEHVVAVEERTLEEEHPDRLASQHELARVYQSDGQIKKAVELLEYVVAIKERTLHEEHPDRLASQHELAWAYQADGQNTQALELLEHVIAVQERTLNEKHPDQLASRRALRVVQSIQTGDRGQDALVISH